MRTRRFPTSRKFLMLLGDIGLITIAYFLSVYLVLNGAALRLFLYSGMLPVLIILTGLMLNINGMYTIAERSFAEIILSVFTANLCAFILMITLTFCIQQFAYSRLVVFVGMTLQTLFLVSWRYLFYRIEKRLHGQRDVMLIGTPEECEHVYNRLIQTPQLRLHLKYVCTDMEETAWKKGAEQVDVIILCPEMRHRYKVKVINYCCRHGKQPVLIPNTFEIFLSGATLSKIDDIPVLRPQDLQPRLEVRVLKRLLDLAIGGIGFVCGLPFMIGTVLAIKLTDPGPVLYSQERVGRGGKPFKVYKFRTMRVDAEKYSGPMLAQENDPRITKTGRFLRAVRLDELPQIWNVLVGDMSIVGPRPERPFFVEKFEKEIPEYAYRHNVKPGITGLAQVYGKYNTTPFDKLVYDLMYIQRAGILTDLTIIIQTVKVLFTKSATEGAGHAHKNLDYEKYAIGEDNIYGDF